MMSASPSEGVEPVAGVPVCPRHPRRESYVRCQRCERPVCPDCQRPAAVGVQCVDCVRAQSQGTRSARTVFGGQAGAGPPRVTYAVIAVCIGVYVLQRVLDDFTTDWAYSPRYTLARPWTMFTSAFLHSPSFLLHIVFNLYALWIIGPYLEALLGVLRFAGLYVLSALGGSVGYLLLAVPGERSATWTGGIVGASGAIFGLFAALVMVNRRLGRDNAGIIGLIVINGALGFAPGLNIAWQAHLGGLITGGIVAAVLVFSPQERRGVLHPLGMAAVVLLLAALTLAKVALVPASLFA